MAPTFMLLLVATLFLGSNAFSPLRDLSGDTDEIVGRYGEELTRADPAYRLPTTTKPILYELEITPYFDEEDPSRAFTFDGRVVITVEVVNSTNEVVLQCNDITINSLLISVSGLTIASFPTCDPIYDFLTVSLPITIQQGDIITLDIRYTGVIQSGMRGFYRSWYNDSTGKRWMGTTQFQPTHARKAFPCYDEPGFKAYFDITINRESTFSPTISNMPIETTTQLANGRISEKFYRTPLMSTYLIAFIVSHYEVLNSTPANNPRPFAIIGRDNAAGTGDWGFEIGTDLLAEMEDFTNYSYYGMADSMDMKQAAIPDFSAGAMENWGLLTYREALILYDPNHSNHFYRQRVANIVSHEIVHMWFGNLVTCNWWENTWLNEGFARLYQYFLTHEVRQDMGYDVRFVVDQVHDAMVSDSLDSAHALTNPETNSPTAISAMFSTISYAKGASIIRMTWHLLGYETYRKALRNYLVTRQFDIAEPQHLFDAFDQAAEEDGALTRYGAGVTISEYFKTWSEKAGVPVLTITVNYDTGDMTINQTRWQRDTGVSAFPSTWHVPITFTRQNDVDFADTKPSHILTQQVTVINKGAPGREWIIFNKQETGYYRINYDEETWDLLTTALKGTERTVIHEINRAQIVDDVFAFARAGVLTYQRALNILSFLEFDDDYAPWIPAITGFNWLRRRLAHETESLESLDGMIIQWSTAVVSRLTFEEQSTDTFMDGILKLNLMSFLCNVRHPGCVNQATLNFQNLRNSGQEISVNLRPSSYCAGLRFGSSEDYDFLFNRFVQHDIASEKLILMTALGCTQDENSLFSFLDELVADTDSFRPQDYASALSAAITGNEENSQKVFRWLQQNLEPTRVAFDGLSTPISYIAARLITEEQLVEFENWLSSNEDILGTAAYNTGVSGVSSARSFLAWTARRIAELNEFFDNFENQDGQEEDGNQIGGEDQGEAEADTDEVTDDPSSANFISVSFMTLFIVGLANFVSS